MYISIKPLSEIFNSSEEIFNFFRKPRCSYLVNCEYSNKITAGKIALSIRSEVLATINVNVRVKKQ